MKLKNKKTGEIATLTLSSNGEELLLMKDNKMITHDVKLSDLEEWKDVPEEPKEYWFIEDNGIIQRSCHYEDLHPTLDNSRKEIGNYFETEEEAEKAVERLRAWKRLKDKGFRFDGWQFLDDRSGIWLRGNLVSGIADELDTLFRGKE